MGTPSGKEPLRVRCTGPFLDSIEAQLGPKECAAFLDSFTMDDIMDTFRYEFDTLEQPSGYPETMRTLEWVDDDTYPIVTVFGIYHLALKTVWLVTIQFG